jgi:polar amino acid transport system substrate-binding protein
LKRLKESGTISKEQVESLVEGATISMEKGYLGYTNRDEGRFAFKSNFVAAFDAVIAEMKASGDLQDIVDQFLK